MEYKKTNQRKIKGSRNVLMGGTMQSIDIFSIGRIEFNYWFYSPNKKRMAGERFLREIVHCIPTGRRKNEISSITWMERIKTLLREIEVDGNLWTDRRQWRAIKFESVIFSIEKCVNLVKPENIYLWLTKLSWNRAWDL